MYLFILIYLYTYTYIYIYIHNYSLPFRLSQGENKGCSFHGAQRLGRAASGTASAIYIPIYLQLSTHLIYVDIIYTCIYIYTYIYLYSFLPFVTGGRQRQLFLRCSVYIYTYTYIYI